MEKNVGEYLWSQMYRPSKLDDVIIPASIKDRFKGYVRDGQIQNLLLTSASPGTGKTTTAFALCNELGIRPLFINASLNNSIDEIRSNVLQYATTVSLLGTGIKIVILDEADRLTPAAQDSLKGLIETVSKNCRFILTANTKSRITDPLQSRCTNIEYAFSQDELKMIGAQMFKRACEILDDQGINYSKPVIAQMVKKYQPDNRGLIEKLQEYAVAHRIIDEGILAQMASASLDAVIGSMKEKRFDQVKQWCFDNQDRLTDEFYQKLFLKAEPLCEKPSVPELVMILDEWQTKHREVPDRFIHFLAMCTHIMMRVQFSA